MDMKKKKSISLIALIFLFVSCEVWEPAIPEGDNSLREHLEGTWNINVYILPSGKKDPILGDRSPIMTFGLIQKDTCELSLQYVNTMQTECVLGDENRIIILDKWGGTEMYDASGNEEKFIDMLQVVNRGFVRNDSLFLLLDMQKNPKYKAICFTR